MRTRSRTRKIIIILLVFFSYFISLRSLFFSFLRFSTSPERYHFDSSKRNCDFLKSIKETEFFAISSAFQSLRERVCIISSFFWISCLRSSYIVLRILSFCLSILFD